MRILMALAISVTTTTARADGCDAYKEQIEVSVGLGGAALQAFNQMLTIPMLADMSAHAEAKIGKARDDLMAGIEAFNADSKALKSRYQSECF